MTRHQDLAVLCLRLATRGGELICALRGDRVGIAGHAMLHLRGEISA